MDETFSTQYIDVLTTHADEVPRADAAAVPISGGRPDDVLDVRELAASAYERGIVTRKVVPFAGSLQASIRPRCARAISFAT